jgi:hypothetical protein
MRFPRAMPVALAMLSGAIFPAIAGETPAAKSPLERE